MEGILKDSSAKYGVHVEQPYVPTALQIDEAVDVHDLNSYPVEVRVSSTSYSSAWIPGFRESAERR